MSIGCALIASLCMALHSLFYKLVVVKFNTDLVQLNYDSAAVFGLILTVPLLMRVGTGNLKIDFHTALLSIISYNLTSIGILLSA